MLRIEAVNDPVCFARLAQRLTADIPTPYTDAILQALGQTDESVESTLVFDAVRHIAAFNNAENDRWFGMALQKHLDSEIPDDIIEIILNRALQSTDPTEESWMKETAGGQYIYDGDILVSGINSARGQAAAALGDLILHDADGHRTQLVAPSLRQLAEDPSVAVRSCVAHLLSACLRHANTEAIAAFEPLIAADDRLLATRYVERLTVYIGMGRPDIVGPVIQRMLASADSGVQESAGRLAAYAGLEFGLPDVNGGPMWTRLLRRPPPGTGSAFTRRRHPRCSPVRASRTTHIPGKVRLASAHRVCPIPPTHRLRLRHSSSSSPIATRRMFAPPQPKLPPPCANGNCSRSMTS